MSSWRHIIVDDVEYTWTCGKAFVVVRRDGRSVFKYTLPYITGMDWNQIERAVHKRYLSITPGLVADTIRKSVKAGEA